MPATMRKILLTGVVLAATCLPARASDFRFCDMQGAVQRATLHPDGAGSVFELSVLVSSAQPERGRTGHSDCSEFIGQVVQARLQIPARFGKPGPGDFVAFNDSAVDGFDAEGHFSGTDVNVSLRDYQAAGLRDGQ